MKSNLIIAITLLCALQIVSGQNKENSHSHQQVLNTSWISNRADGHAPIGVMGDHMHHKGEWMFSYRYMSMEMDGNLSQTDEVSNADIHATYMVAPQNMNMKMHMIGGMYAPSDKLTFVVMTHLLENNMELLMRTGMSFKTSSSGLGDTKVGVLYSLFNINSRAMHVNLGLSVPTGSLTETGATPMTTLNEIRLGYNMQLGSGTWDPSVGITYLKQYDHMSYGAQTSYLYRIGENNEGYTIGNKWNATFWSAYKFSKSVSTSLRADYNSIGSINGSDNVFSDMMVMPMKGTAPVFDATNSGKQQLDVLLGVNYGFFKGVLKGMRLEIEAGLPVYQYVKGIQMENTFMFTAGIQYALGH
tara:strand:- start:40745 stop:41818 length:1074 start_codon:yes stop_codon:yes gene_type:complete